MPTIVLIDISSIAHPIWHMSQSEPDQNHTATATVCDTRGCAHAASRQNCELHAPRGGA